jgi:DNA polymerase I
MKTELIHGKDNTPNVVSIDFKDSIATLIKNDGSIEKRESPHWALYNQDHDGCFKLSGDQHFKYCRKYKSLDELRKDYGVNVYQKQSDGFVLWNPKEQFMVRNGVTYYKGLTPKDVSILSFDLETTSLVPSQDNKILLISNTYRDHLGNIERRLFSYEDYKSTKEMVYAWCHYVRSKKPNIICGHNIFGFDIPYLAYYVSGLPIGHDGSNCEIAERTSEFRKDGSQTYSYNNVTVNGAEVIDTMFLAYKYDAATRRFDSYGLKSIIRQTGLERSGRQHYDGGQIRLRYQEAREWAKIKQYAEHDADDALALFDLMIPSYFYFTQSVPKTLQQVVNGASGSQVNGWMLRSYLQDGHSVPKASEVVQFEGAISFGNPGVYKNVSKVDVASLYPSIIIEGQIYDKNKDPKGNFLEMVRYFTRERLNNKRLATETGDEKYRDIEQAQKIFINSAYGFMGATGLNYNSPSNAALITQRGREILQEGMDWASNRGFTVINGDTDSFCYTGSKDFKEEIISLNMEFPEQINWTDDGQYASMVIIKAKNYAMLTPKGIKIKGSGLKATMKEPALREFIDKMIEMLLKGNEDDIRELYQGYVRSIHNVDANTITLWSSKKTITKSVLEPKRTNEQRVKDAIQKAGKPVQEGDKIFVFFDKDDSLSLVESFNGLYSKKKLLGKLYNTVKVFETVLDLKKFPNYTLKKYANELTKV